MATHSMNAGNPSLNDRDLTKTFLKSQMCSGRRAFIFKLIAIYVYKKFAKQ